jgi:hypothetical protein
VASRHDALQTNIYLTVYQPAENACFDMIDKRNNGRSDAMREGMSARQHFRTAHPPDDTRLPVN